MTSPSEAPNSPALEVRALTKRYGKATVVDDLSFSVYPGAVTGFLGPNGAGKSTTMKMIMGLAHPTEGEALVMGRRIQELPAPAQSIGALIDPQAVQTFRTGAEHLEWVARMCGLPDAVVGEKLELVGLAHAADRRVAGYSLGMKQRLALAAALIGDPPILMLDEPVNGLDAEGIVWMRKLLKDFAHAGRTVFLSSHLMAEMELTADRVIIIDRGRFIADMTVAELTAHSAEMRVIVRAADTPALARVLAESGAVVTRPVREDSDGDDPLEVSGLDSAAIGRIAQQSGIPLIELRQERATLEQAFRSLTGHQTAQESEAA